jgi:hypothetical protein
MKERRARKVTTLATAEVEALIGRLFHVLCPLTQYKVEIYRVVGFTKSKKSVHLERVPLVRIGEDEPHYGGNRKIDLDWLTNNPVLDEQQRQQRRSFASVTSVPRKEPQSGPSRDYVYITIDRSERAYLLGLDEHERTFSYTEPD